MVRISSILAMLIALALPAHAESSPKEVVKSVSDVVLSSILANKAKLDADPSFLMGLVENKMIPIIDQQRMAKLALGKNWKKISKTQQGEFIDGFKRLLVKTYAGAFKAYTGQDVTYGKTKFNKSGSKAIVNSQIHMPGSTPIQLQYRLYQPEPGQWKVYDANIAGLGLLKTYRVQFSEQIQRDGIDKTIAQLKSVQL